jgi:hypothetical protein
VKTCIQCGADVDVLVDVYTLYQVDGQRYIYCETCKSPREPYISPAEVMNLKSQVESYRKSIGRMEWISIVIAVAGFSLGWFLGAK